MIRQADQLFVQEQLRDLRITEPTFEHCPALLGARPETPHQEQFDSAWEDAEEDGSNATGVLDAELDASMDKEMDASGHLHCLALADRCCQSNRAL